MLLLHSVSTCHAVGYAVDNSQGMVLSLHSELQQILLYPRSQDPQAIGKDQQSVSITQTRTNTISRVFSKLTFLLRKTGLKNRTESIIQITPVTNYRNGPQRTATDHNGHRL